jgi:hypothetical protein
MTATLKEEARKFLAEVPPEYVFRCYDGAVFKNLEELKDGLERMTDEAFTHHSNAEKKDFTNWVKDVIGDEKLAADLKTASNRTQAAKRVSSRIILLKKRLS